MDLNLHIFFSPSSPPAILLRMGFYRIDEESVATVVPFKPIANIITIATTATITTIANLPNEMPYKSPIKLPSRMPNSRRYLNSKRPVSNVSDGSMGSNVSNGSSISMKICYISSAETGAYTGSYSEATIDQYVFCGNCPTMGRDPDGLSTVRIVMGKQKLILNDPTCDQLRKTLSGLPDQSITRLQISGHGGIEGIYLGKPGSPEEAGLIFDPSVAPYAVYNDDNSSFADSIRNKLARDADIDLDGCDTAREWHWPFPRNKTNIAKQLSLELKGHKVMGNAGSAISNELSVPMRRDLSIRLGSEAHAVAIKRTYINGQ